MKVYLINQGGKVYEAVDLIFGNNLEKFQAALLLGVEKKYTMISEHIISPADLQVVLLQTIQRSSIVQDCRINAIMHNITYDIERIDMFDVITDMYDMGSRVVVATDATSAVKLVRESKDR